MDSIEFAKLASRNCARCNGEGTRSRVICNCVWRNVFRECLKKYHNLEHAGTVTRRGASAEMLETDYRVDFASICRKALSDLKQRMIWEWYFVADLSEPECIRIVNRKQQDASLHRRNFYHLAYKVEARCGKALWETRPYALFPLREYFDERRGSVAFPRIQNDRRRSTDKGVPLHLQWEYPLSGTRKVSQRC